MPKIIGMTTKEVASIFQVSIHTVRDWIESTDPERGMRAIKIGNVCYVSEDEVRRFYRMKHGQEKGKS